MSTTARGTGGTFIRFRVGTTGASGHHAAYITRERAVLDREQGILLYHLPDHVRDAGDYDELRSNLVAYAEAREEVEVARHRSRGEPRTHYRVTASFERDVSSEQALGMVKEWLEREFPRARGFAAVHRDTEQTHVHVWIDARQVDGKKVQLSRSQHRNLDVSWNRIYSREMGRDPREHERKKEQTREAKRQGWEREQRPEYPPRVRRDARELAPHWERREIGEQAARMERPERGGQTFLERVRSAAGRDFREASSWAELEQRLDRHGLRIEALGRGMAVTDGRHYVKASSVDREASRGRLEQRFGMSLADHRERQQEFEHQSPKVKEVMRDLHTLDRREWLREDLGRAIQERDTARARVAEQGWARERVEKSSQAFNRALADVYQDPGKARAAYEQYAREQGIDRATEVMHERPETFEQLRTVEQRRFFGLARSHDSEPARERARNAAELGREAEGARAALPGEAERRRTDAELRKAEQRVTTLEKRIEQTRENTHTRARIGLAMQQLLPEEVNDLQRWLTAPHRQLTLELRRTVDRMAPEQLRELVEWARAPHRQLPASAIRAFKALVQERGMERGSQ